MSRKSLPDKTDRKFAKQSGTEMNIRKNKISIPSRFVF